MDDYLLALVIEDLSQLEIEPIEEDLKDIIPPLFRELLARHRLVSAIENPGSGIWSVVFALKDDLITDLEEQLTTLRQTGIKLIRKELEAEFGLATGGQIDFKLIFISCSQVDKTSDVADIKKIASEKPKARLRYRDLVTAQEFSRIIENKELTTYLQPLLSLPAEEIIGYEVLTRGPTEDLFSAADLFGAAGYFGLKDQLELAALEQGLEQGLKLPSTKKVSVNISPHLLLDDRLYEILYRSEFEGLLSRVILELTEHLPVEKTDQIKEQIAELQRLDIDLAVDDAGCGYFDLQTVKILEPAIVKLCITVIDKLDQEIKDNRQDFKETVTSIRDLGSQVLGEGVERAAQAQLLKEFNVDLAQGYYYARPQPASEVLSD